MPENQTTKTFFSVAMDLVQTGQTMPYDLYVNASSVESREKFVRIFPMGEILTEMDLQRFKDKYHQLYVPEMQRSAYLGSICKSSGRNLQQKTAVLKDAAIHHLNTLFDPKKIFSTQFLGETITGCRDVVENLVDVVQNHDIDQIQDLIGSLSFHDFYTYDHSINVSMYSILLYRFVRPMAKRDEIVQAGLGGLLHDIGKIRIPTEIINKTTKLTDAEFAEIQKHPDFGAEMLNHSELALPSNIDRSIISRIIHEHHENFDGTGYPGKIAGEHIHLMARVTAIADFFDAITTKRSYSTPLSTKDALALMQNSTGKKIDPILFELFLAHSRLYDRGHHANLEVRSDFDPCQPQAQMDLIRCLHPHNAIEPEENQDRGFGKIRFMGEKKSLAPYGLSDSVEVVEKKTAPKKKAVGSRG